MSQKSAATHFVVFVMVQLFVVSFVVSNAAQQKPKRVEDIEHYSNELQKRHADVFHTLPKTEFEAAVERLKNESAELNDDQFAFRLMKLTASVGDGHTTVVPEFSKYRVLPVQFYWFKDGLFVVKTAGKHLEAFGARVTHFGELPVQDALQKIKSYISQDNEMQFMNQAPQFLGFAEFMLAIGAWDNLNGGKIQLAKSGKTFTLHCKSLDPLEASRTRWKSRAGPAPLYTQKQNLDHWNDWLKDSKTLYFKYNRCRNPQAFNKLVNGTVGFIQQNDVDKFVLDLRHNQGGNSAIFDPLFEYLNSQRKLNRKGKLFVLIGRQTFSSAVFNAMKMKKTNAIFIGEPTGGKPNHFGEIKSFVLPNSKIKIMYSTKFHRLTNETGLESVKPDIQVELTFNDWNNGRDPVLQKAIEFRLPLQGK